MSMNGGAYAVEAQGFELLSQADLSVLTDQGYGVFGRLKLFASNFSVWLGILVYLGFSSPRPASIYFNTSNPGKGGSSDKPKTDDDTWRWKPVVSY
jgi:hypothetical protein